MTHARNDLRKYKLDLDKRIQKAAAAAERAGKAPPEALAERYRVLKATDQKQRHIYRGTKRAEQEEIRQKHTPNDIERTIKKLKGIKN